MGKLKRYNVRGEIRIWVEPVNFPITFSHPHLLNGEKQVEKRATTDETEYLIICPSEFKDAPLSLAKMHSIDVAAVNIDKINTEGYIDGKCTFEEAFKRINAKAGNTVGLGKVVLKAYEMSQQGAPPFNRTLLMLLLLLISKYYLEIPCNINPDTLAIN